MDDDYKIIDYSIQLNDVIQLMIRSAVLSTNNDATPFINDVVRSTCNNDNEDPENQEDMEKIVKVGSKYYHVGEKVDIQEPLYGSWFEFIITDIIAKRKHVDSNGLCEEENIQFKGIWDK